MANEIDGLMGIDEWSGFVDPWDKAEEPDDPFDTVRGKQLDCFER